MIVEKPLDGGLGGVGESTLQPRSQGISLTCGQLRTPRPQVRDKSWDNLVPRVLAYSSQETRRRGPLERGLPWERGCEEGWVGVKIDLRYLWVYQGRWCHPPFNFFYKSLSWLPYWEANAFSSSFVLLKHFDIKFFIVRHGTLPQFHK